MRLGGALRARLPDMGDELMGRAREDDGISRFAEDSPGLCLLLWYDYCVFPSQKHPSWNNRFYSYPRQEECPGDSKSCAMAVG